MRYYNGYSYFAGMHIFGSSFACDFGVHEALKCWLNELSSMLPQDSDGHTAHAELCPTGTVPVQGRQAIDPWIDGFKDA